MQSDLFAILNEKNRQYHRIHAQWMETSIFNKEAHTRVKAALKEAREQYLQAYNNAYPTHIAF